MSMFEGGGTPPKLAPMPIPLSEIDYVLTAQIIVAWAGEGGEEKRLGWWRSDLISEFGGEDLFRRLLPNTWSWAVLQGAPRNRETQGCRATAPGPRSGSYLVALQSRIRAR